MTFPKDHINIGRHGTKHPFIIPVVRKIFPLCISQFNKLVFFNIFCFVKQERSKKSGKHYLMFRVQVYTGM